MLQPDLTKDVKPLNVFAFISFDVVGTLIDFEGAILKGLTDISAAEGAALDPEAALTAYRAARYEPEAGRFPDDLARCYGRICIDLGLPDTPAYRVDMVKALAEAEPFPDSAAALSRLGKHMKLVAMTNARRWAFDLYATRLGQPFHASFTVDETGCEKPDPAFFEHVFDALAAEGGTRSTMLHAAQSQHHDIGISRALGMTNAWIERRHDAPGYGGTIEPARFTRPDHHFRNLTELADAVDASFHRHRQKTDRTIQQQGTPQ